jgi:hypothetical protein
MLQSAFLEGAENPRAYEPRSDAPGTLRRCCSVVQRLEDCRRRIEFDRDAVLLHPLIIFLQPGRQSEPQFNFSLAAGGIDRLAQSGIEAVVDGLIDARDRKRQRIGNGGEAGQVFPKLAASAAVARRQHGIDTAVDQLGQRSAKLIEAALTPVLANTSLDNLS